MVYIYDLGIKFYLLFIYIASFFNAKADLWIKGRENIYDSLPSFSSHKVIWFHCASLGEFEQGRPIIEAISREYPSFKIFLTFFSPSGYEVRKNYSKADHICYLPIDSKKNAAEFISKINPSLVIFIKYEFWYHYFKELNQRNIPLYIASAVFRPNQVFFKWYGSFFKKILSLTHYFFVQNRQSLDLLNKIGLKNSIISGDTRFDRVITNSNNPPAIPEIETFKNSNSLLVAGSTWPAEEDLLIEFLNKNKAPGIKIVIAPHEVHSSRIEHLFNSLLSWKPVKFSELSSKSLVDCNILIIDNIGMLSSIYQYADFVIIGGGFGTGLHNILEPAAFGCPVFFGPDFEKFPEATDIINIKGGFSIKNADELGAKINLLIQEPLELERIKKANSEYVKSNAGATDIIINYLKESDLKIPMHQ